jgi:excisionase family DNA binding protein
MFDAVEKHETMRISNKKFIANPMRKFLSPSQIAKYEEVSRETVTRWIRQGSFPGTRRVGRRYKVPIESYNKWREGTEVSPQKENH